MNVIRDTMGYVPTMKFLPNEVFKNGFTREHANDYFDMFLGSPLSSTEKQMKTVRTLKRYKPRARGRVSPILKRSSHITVIVEEGE